MSWIAGFTRHPTEEKMSTENTETKTETTQASETNASLDDVIARIDALSAAKDGAPVEKEFTREQFDAYVTEQLAKAEGEEPEPAKKRLTALKTAIEAAKQFFAAGKPAKLPVYQDPFQMKPDTAKTADAPTGVKTESVAFENETVAKKVALGLASLAKQLVTEGSEVRHGVIKSGKVSVSKAGEAAAMLAKIAQMFGIDMNDPKYQDEYSFKWKVADAVCVIAEAAKLEQVMTTLSATLGGAPAPAPAEMAAEKTEKAAKAVDDGWPMDMNGTSFDSKSGKHVEKPLAWNNASE